jgi:2'-5' RNA ligase
MRNKQVIEQLNNKAKQAAENLYRDADSYKPHVTMAYVKDQLSQIANALEQQQQYLDLED